MDFEKLKNIFFLGIGGIGMSAIARYFNARNVNIFGYDLRETELTKKMEAEGMHIHYEDCIDLIPLNIDLVIYTPAIPNDNLEYQFFIKQNFQIRKRAEILGIISKKHKTIAIAGTHGKTSTSAMLTHILKQSRLDCTAFVGGIMSNYDTNFLNGKGEWLVVEADEYDRSFLQLTPYIIGLTSVDPDHLDIYQNWSNMLETGFYPFLENRMEEGMTFVNERVFEHVKTIVSDGQVYGFDASNKIVNIKHVGMKTTFDFVSEYGHLENLEFNLIGRHNLENLCLALTISMQIGIAKNSITNAVESFKGIYRRMEIVYKNEDVIFIDDYAHHPTELLSTISSIVNLFPKKKILGIFQPHLFSRTRDFAPEFAASLAILDEIILLPIYPAREKRINNVTSSLIYDDIKKKSKILVVKNELIELLENLSFDVLITLGAGDINKWKNPIKEFLQNRKLRQ